MYLEETAVGVDEQYSYMIRLTHDQDSGPPWENDCITEGMRFEWVRDARGKRPWETHISGGRSNDTLKFNMWQLVRNLRTIGGCRKREAHEQALWLREYWRKYLNDSWIYVGMEVCVLRDNEELPETSSVWGYEWDYSTRSEMWGYLRDEARGQAMHLIEQDKKERAEREYWAQRDVVTS